MLFCVFTININNPIPIICLINDVLTLIYNLNIKFHSYMSSVLAFECEFPDCGKRFTTRFSLKRHYYIHSKKKTFTCEFCPKSFALPQYLREHQFTHTNQQPFLCGVDGCTESFRQRGKLSLHRRTHETFKKKDYRLLNAELSFNKKSDSLIKNNKRIREPENLCSEGLHSSGENNICAQLLSQNWSPLKRQKVK